jgi:hypothetical protein
MVCGNPAIDRFQKRRIEFSDALDDRGEEITRHGNVTAPTNRRPA